MGRITIFVQDDCTESSLLQSMFDNNSIPYEEISLTKFPERRSDMITLSNKITTPQVFFNNLHVGSLNEIIELFETYYELASISSSKDDNDKNPVLDRIQKSVIDHRLSDFDFKLRLPNNTINHFQQDNFKEYELWIERMNEYDFFQTSTCCRLSIKNITRNLMGKLPHQTIYQFPKFHTKCFKGKAAVQIFQREFAFLKTMENSIEFGQKLVDIGVLHGIPNGKKEGTFTLSGLFRVQPCHCCNIKNKFIHWSRLGMVNGGDPQPLLTLSRLKLQLDKAIAKCRKNSQHTVGLDLVRFDKTFQSFEENLCLLQLANLGDMNEKCRVTYFLNVYNLMVKHAIILQQYTIDTKSGFHSKIQYIIGNHTYTLDEIYHGILRCNAKHPKSGKHMFTNIDDRNRFKCRSVNPRIHFALLSNYLVCQNDLINVLFCRNEFHEEALSKELLIVSQEFCKNDDRFLPDDKTFTLTLPMFARDCMDDFIRFWNGIDNDFPRVMSTYLVDEKREILDRMLQQSNSCLGKYIKVDFGQTIKRGVSCTCATSIGNKHFFKKSNISHDDAEEELNLIPEAEERYLFTTKSQLSFSEKDYDLGKSWEGMSSDSSLNLSSRSWELPEPLNCESEWDKFFSISTQFPVENKRTPRTSVQRKKLVDDNYISSPSTINTASTTKASPSSVKDNSSTVDSISHGLCLPDFPENSDNAYSTSHSEVFSNDSNSIILPETRRIESKSLFYDYEQNEDMKAQTHANCSPLQHLHVSDASDDSSYFLSDNVMDGFTTDQDVTGVGSLFISHDIYFEELFESKATI